MFRGGIIRYREMVGDDIRICAPGELGGHFISMLYRWRLLTLQDLHREVRSNRRSRGEWRWHHSCPNDFLSAQANYARFI